MKLSLKLALFAFVAIAVAGAEGAVEVLAPRVAQEAALSQFDDSADSARSMRVYTRARPAVTDLLWLAVPITGIALFAGDFTRCFAARH